MSLFVPNILHVGKYTYSAQDLYVANPEKTKIGSFCSIGCMVRIGHGTHPLNYLSSSPYLYLDRLGYKTNITNSHNEWEKLKPVIIGHDVWIGDDVWIKNGISIGTGVIIGAKSVVTKNVPPYAIVVGNPAKIIKYRFSKEIIKRLLKTEWWKLPQKVIKQIPYDNIDEALRFIENKRGLNKLCK